MKENVKIEPKWRKSREQIWNDHFERLTSKESTVHKVLHIGRYLRYSAAAAILIILLVPLIYTKSIVAQKGMHLSFNLPDGSSVTLNAGSELSYKPFIWFARRTVRMDGEAYFEVEKGSEFSVISDNGDVKVLGTRFNVISRDKNFSVCCISGRVMVNSGNRVILEKQERASLGSDGKLVVDKVEEMEKVISWKENVFYFTEAPLKYVIEEISRQYNIKIDYPENNSFIYTGNFSRERDVETVLDIVALPFGLKPEKCVDGYKLEKQ